VEVDFLTDQYLGTYLSFKRAELISKSGYEVIAGHVVSLGKMRGHSMDFGNQTVKECIDQLDSDGPFSVAISTIKVFHDGHYLVVAMEHRGLKCYIFLVDSRSDEFDYLRCFVTGLPDRIVAKVIAQEPASNVCRLPSAKSTVLHG